MIHIIAHRGNNAHAPENTLGSFLQALDTGATLIEMDLRASRDGVPILIHDRTVDRTTPGRGPVAELSASDLRALDAGAWRGPEFIGQTIPAFEQAARLCRGRAGLVLDLKVQGIAPALARVLRDTAFDHGQVYPAVWDAPQAADVRTNLPAAPMLQSGDAPESFDSTYFQEKKAQGFAGFSMSWASLSRPFIESAHDWGMIVFAWTVNDRDEMREAIAAGVEGIITDDPGLLFRVRHQELTHGG